MTSLTQKIGTVVGKLRKEKDYAELLNGSVITFVLRVASFLILYVLNFVIANAYGAEELGHFTLSLTLLDVALMAVLFGLDTAMVRFIAQYESNAAIRTISRIVRRVLAFLIPMSLLCGGVLWLISGIIAKWLFHDEGLTKDFQMMALVLPFSVLTRLFSAGFRGRKQIRRSLLFDSVGIRAVNLVLLLMLQWVFGVRHAWILESLAIAYVINTILSWGVWQANLKQTLAHASPAVIGPRRVPKLRTIIRTSLPMYLTASMYFVMGWTDTVVLGIFKSSDVVGIYSVVLKLSIITSFVYISVNTILLPKFSELHYNGQMHRLRNVIESSTKLMFWTSMPVILVLTVFAQPVLAIFGPAFPAGRVALLILCLGQVVNSATGSVISLLNMTGHQDKSRNALVVASMLNVVGNMALVPHFGMVGASVATAVSSVMRDVIASFYSYRIFGFRTWYVPRRQRTGREQGEKTEEAVTG